VRLLILFAERKIEIEKHEIDCLPLSLNLISRRLEVVRHADLVCRRHSRIGSMLKDRPDAIWTVFDNIETDLSQIHDSLPLLCWQNAREAATPLPAEFLQPAIALAPPKHLPHE